MTDSKIQVALEFGFSYAQICLALQRNTFLNAGELVDYLSEEMVYWEVEACLSPDELAQQMKKTLSLQEEKDSTQQACASIKHDLCELPPSLYEETYDLKYKALCLRCRERKRNVLSFPCCHMGLCLVCSYTATHCPSRDCATFIESTMLVHW